MAVSLEDALEGDRESKSLDPVEPVEEPTQEVEAAEADVAEAPVEEPEAEAKPEPTEEPAPVAAPQGEMVPVSVVADLRRQLREIKQAQAQPKPERKPLADPLENPQEFSGQMMQTVQAIAHQQKMETSRMLAEQVHGAEKVEQALKFFDENPQLSQALLNERSPFDAAVKAFDKEQLAKEIGDPDKWREAERERIRAELAAEMVAGNAKQAVAKRAPSLANLPGTGGGATDTWNGPINLSDVLP